MCASIIFGVGIIILIIIILFYYFVLYDNFDNCNRPGEYVPGVKIRAYQDKTDIYEDDVLYKSNAEFYRRYGLYNYREDDPCEFLDRTISDNELAWYAWS